MWQIKFRLRQQLIDINLFVYFDLIKSFEWDEVWKLEKLLFFAFKVLIPEGLEPFYKLHCQVIFIQKRFELSQKLRILVGDCQVRLEAFLQFTTHKFIILNNFGHSLVAHEWNKANQAIKINLLDNFLQPFQIEK